jgi:uridine kinase
MIENGERRSKLSQIIAIDGPAGAGKTTLAKKIAGAISNKSVHVIHMDDLYDGWDNALTQSLTRTLESNIAKPVFEGKSYEYRKFSWLTMRFEELQR